MSRVLLVINLLILAVVFFPAAMATWFWATSPGTADQDGSAALALLKVVGVLGLVVWLCFSLMRHWRPDSLRLRPMKSKRTELRVTRGSNVLALGAILTVSFLNLPGTIFERLWLTLAGAVCLVVGVHLSVAVHELGHFLAALLVGLEPLHFRVGRGPRIVRRINRAGLLVEWQLIPSGGYVKAWPANGEVSRWRQWVMIAGGPAASLAVCGALWSLVPHWPAVTDGASWLFMIECAGVAVLAWTAWLLLLNLLPHRVMFDGQHYASDGHHLLALLRPSQSTPAELTRTVHLLRLFFFWESGQRARAWAALDEVQAAIATPVWLDLPLGFFAAAECDYAVARETLERYLAAPGQPDDLRRLAQRFHLLACAGLGEWEIVRTDCAALLTEVPEATQATWLEYCATLPIFTGRPELLPEARRWMDAALALKPDSTDFQTTHVCLLVEEGQGALAEPLLRKLLRSRPGAEARGVLAFYLALVLQRRHAPDSEIAQWREGVLRWSTQAWLHRRADAELPVESPVCTEAMGEGLLDREGLPSQARRGILSP